MRLNKLKLTTRNSKESASCRMAFFKAPYSRKIDQIRMFTEWKEDENWGVYIYCKDGRRMASRFVYPTLSEAAKDTVGFINNKNKERWVQI